MKTLILLALAVSVACPAYAFDDPPKRVLHSLQLFQDSELRASSASANEKKAFAEAILKHTNSCLAQVVLEVEHQMRISMNPNLVKIVRKASEAGYKTSVSVAISSSYGDSKTSVQLKVAVLDSKNNEKWGRDLRTPTEYNFCQTLADLRQQNTLVFSDNLLEDFQDRVIGDPGDREKAIESINRL